MRQTKESNKRAPGRVVIYISVHLVSICTLTFSNVLLVLALNLIVHKSSYCKCSLAWCQARPFFYSWSEHIPSKWENTRSNMQVLTKIKNPTIIVNNISRWGLWDWGIGQHHFKWSRAGNKACCHGCKLHVLGPIVMCVFMVPEEGEFGYPFFLIVHVFDALNRSHMVYNLQGHNRSAPSKSWWTNQDWKTYLESV